MALCLPCVFGQSLQVLQGALQAHDPAVVLALGLAAGRSDLSVERVAINVDDARIPDNAGAQPVDEPVIAGAPDAYFSRLPIKAIVAALREAGLPASVSQSAGTFVCNHVFFGLMHMLAAPPPPRACRVHAPAGAARAGGGASWPAQPAACHIGAGVAAGACTLPSSVPRMLPLAGGSIA
jgi:pyroglutamyl-peptidase